MDNIKLVQKMIAKNKASDKQCMNCKHYIKNYKDDYTLKHFGYGEVKYRSACSWGGNYGFVSHNPAATCNRYETKRNI